MVEPTHLKKYARQIGSWNPKVRGENKQMFELPPPRYYIRHRICSLSVVSSGWIRYESLHFGIMALHGLVSSGSPSQFHSWHHGHMPVFKETFKNQFWSIEKTRSLNSYCHTVDGSEIRLTSWYGKYLHYLQGFIHVRWLALGFLNHQ